MQHMQLLQVQQPLGARAARVLVPRHHQHHRCRCRAAAAAAGGSGGSSQQQQQQQQPRRTDRTDYAEALAQAQKVAEVRARAASAQLDDAQLAAFTEEQRKFLARKRSFHAGESPALPACPGCGGAGTVVCWHCKGTAVNDKDAVGIFGTEWDNMIQQNGVIDLTPYVQLGGPCWFCRGKPDVPCLECNATGIKDFDLEIYTGD